MPRQPPSSRSKAPRSKTLTSNRKIGVLSGRTERRLFYTIFSFNVTAFGPSVEENHLTVCRELQRPWQEDMEYMEVLRVQHSNQRAEQY
jgi:hypothetical protein